MAFVYESLSKENKKYNSAGSIAKVASCREWSRFSAEDVRTGRSREI